LKNRELWKLQPGYGTLSTFKLIFYLDPASPEASPMQARRSIKGLARCTLGDVMTNWTNSILLDLPFLKMHPAIKLNKFYPFKKIRTVEPQSREER